MPNQPIQPPPSPFAPPPPPPPAQGTNTGLIIVITVLLTLFFVALMGAGTWWYMYQVTGAAPPALDQFDYLNEQAERVLPPEEALVPTAVDETAGWKVYRNEALGVEFKYPPEINGTSVSPAVDSQLSVKLYSSKYNVLSVRSASFKDLTTMKVGVDLGGQGGYIYDPNINAWRERENKETVISWDKFFEYLQLRAPQGMTAIKLYSGEHAYPYGGSAYESSWVGYRMYDTSRKVSVDVIHNMEYVPENMRLQVAPETAAVKEMLLKIAATVKI